MKNFAVLKLIPDHLEHEIEVETERILTGLSDKDPTVQMNSLICCLAGILFCACRDDPSLVYEEALESVIEVVNQKFSSYKKAADRRAKKK